MFHQMYPKFQTMVDLLTMILLLFAAILSYAAETPVFTPSGHLRWVFAMIYFLCNNNGVEDKL
jgi:hypothetical protein